jgi:effector-binding domain-containing protein
VVGFLVLLVLAGFLFPRNIEIERSRTINAPVEMIYDQVNNLHLWENWSPWHKIDTAMGITYNKGGIGKGASYSWTSDHKSVGNGTLTISDAKPFEFIDTQMDFGDQGMGTAGFVFKESEAGVEVSWDMHSDIGNNPIGRWFGLLMKKSINEAYDRGLADMEAECNSLLQQDWYYVKIKNKPAIQYYSLGTECTIDEIGDNMKKMFTQLYTDLAKAGLEITGSPFALYHTWGETSKFDCCVPVQEVTMPLKGISSNTLAENKYAVIKYVGDYSGMLAPYTYMEKWIEFSMKEVNGSVMEVYKTDPESEPDPTKWITYIMYPIK